VTLGFKETGAANMPGFKVFFIQWVI